MRIFFLYVLFFYFSSLCLSFANSEDVVNLIIETNKIATPISQKTMLKNANQFYGTSEDKDDDKIFEPEEDLGNNKVEKAFYKFIDKKVVDNKLNSFSSRVGDMFGELAD